jgi:hypothetical protein
MLAAMVAAALAEAGLPAEQAALIKRSIARQVPSPDRADTVAQAFSRRGAASVAVDLESHAGESITGDVMTKAW